MVSFMHCIDQVLKFKLKALLNTFTDASVFPCRDIDIWLPEMEQQDVPSGWWDAEADRCLLIGVYKHGMWRLY